VSLETAIEVVCSTPERQVLAKLSVDTGTTARRAMLACGLQDDFPDIDFATCPLGVWGRPVDDSYPLAEGDRLEAYRPLLIDPREARRELAKEGRSMGQLPED